MHRNQWLMTTWRDNSIRIMDMGMEVRRSLLRSLYLLQGGRKQMSQLILKMDSKDILREKVLIISAAFCF